MQVGALAINTVNSLSADGQQAVRSAYGQQAGAGLQPKVQEQSATERAKVEQLNTAKSEVEKKVAQPPTKNEVDKAFQQLNDAFAAQNSSLTVNVERDEDTGIDVFKVTDKLTKEVILQLPPKAVVEMAKSMDQAAADKVQLISEKA